MAWQLDTSHSSVKFSARHMMISTVRGQFKEFSGKVQFRRTDPQKTWVAVEIKADSIDTHDAPAQRTSSFSRLPQHRNSP